MNTEKEELALIERYANFQLSEEELVVFEQRLSTDHNFAQKVRLYQESEAIIRNSHATIQEQTRRQEWQNLLDDTNNNAPKENTIPWKWRGGIAASLLLFLGIWQANYKTEKPDLAVLLEDSWNQKIGLDYKALRGQEEDSLRTIITKAFDHYEHSSYEKTLALLNDYGNKTYYEDVLLLRGLSLYKKGAVNDAIKTLDTLAKYPTQKKSKVALWYQGLIYLEQDDVDNATLFLDIPNVKNKPIQLKK